MIYKRFPLSLILMEMVGLLKRPPPWLGTSVWGRPYLVHGVESKILSVVPTKSSRADPWEHDPVLDKPQ